MVYLKKISKTETGFQLIFKLRLVVFKITSLDSVDLNGINCTRNENTDH